MQISALLEAERAVGGVIQKGDLVGVYLSFDPFDLDVTGQDTASGEEADSVSALPRPTNHRPNRPAPIDRRRQPPAADQVPEREPARVPARACHQRSDDQRAGELENDDEKDPASPRSPAPSTSSPSPSRRSSPSGSCSPPSSATSGCRSTRPPSATTAPVLSPSERLRRGEVMEPETPTVVIGHDMSPEFFVDVSTALHSMGVAVK